MHDLHSTITMLPSGFSDLMPEGAQKEARSIAVLMDTFASFGYQRIKPPLMEFEESLLAPGPGAALSRDTFRVMDPASHRMMGLRADITPQIARIVSTRFEMSDEVPLRLTYANDVLRTRAGQLRTARQFVQVGCELIGGGEALEGTVELCAIAAKGLDALGVSGITIDFTWPRFVDAVLADEGLGGSDAARLRDALQRRDKQAVKDGVGSDAFKGFLVTLLDACGDLDRAVGVLSALDMPKSLAQEWAILQELAQDLPKALKALGISDVRLSFDPFETRGFEYHSGVAFAIFSPAMRGELGRGGQYDLNGENGAAQKARGFTLYMDTILSGMPPAPVKNCLAVPVQTSWDEIKNWQEKGWSVARTPDIKKRPEGCTHVLENGQVVAVK